MMNPEGKWCVYDPKLPGFIAEYSTMIEAQSWVSQMAPGSDLTVVFVPTN